MGFTPHPKFLALCRDLHHQARPLTQDEALGQIALALQQTLGESRILFYLSTFSLEVDPWQLLPYPARLLRPDVFVYETARCKSYFAFETECAYCLPLLLNFHHWGYLFWESKNRPLAQSTLILVAILTGQIVPYLNELGCLVTPCACPFEPPVPLKIDPIHRRVWVAGELLPVSDKGFIFLQLLQQWHEKGEPCPRDLLYRAIYKDEVMLFGNRETRLASLATRLRQKLAQIPGRPVQIETIRDTGYRLCLCPAPLSG